ncbi:MAG: hypothetical protein RJA66_840 [Actinomycetota bacterium]
MASSFFMLQAVPRLPSYVPLTRVPWRSRTIDALLRINQVLGVQVPPSAQKRSKKRPQDLSRGLFFFIYLALVARCCTVDGIANTVNTKAVGRTWDARRGSGNYNDFFALLG